jgi:threonine dehydratase
MSRFEHERQVVAPDSDDLRLAREAVSRHLSPTPLVSMDVGGPAAWLKLESFQPTGAFKVRGAIAALSRLSSNQQVLAVSAGNHALGIAWASQRLGIPATVVIAETASAAKRERLEALPVRLIRHGGSYDEAEAYALEMARDQPGEAVFISGYNDRYVIAGQSTIADEIAAQVSGNGPITIVVPVGGGGMASGIALRAAELRGRGREVRLVGVETEASTAMWAAVAAGRIVEIEVAETLADGLAGNLEPGSATVEIVARHVDTLVQVSELEIAAAIRHLATNAGIVAEGAGAASTAALLGGHVRVDSGDVVAVVSGRNISPDTFAKVLMG